MIDKSIKRILIIDNHDSIRLILKKKLEKAGYLVVEKSEGQNGIDYYRNNPTDLVIADIFLPELEGLKTIIQIRKEFPGARIIAKTENQKGIGFKKYSPLQSAKYFGALRTFTSPINIQKLLEVVKELTSPQIRYLRRNTRYKKFNVRENPCFNISFPGE